MEKTEESSWQSLGLCDALNHLFKTGHLSDVSICVGADDGHQQIFKCHKFVLACASPYFEAMFYGSEDSVEKKQAEIKILDVEPDDFKFFLDYVYGRREIKNSDEFLIETLQSFVYMGHKFLQAKGSNFGVGAIKNALSKLRLVNLIKLFGSVIDVGHEHLASAVFKQLKSVIAETTTFNQALLNFDMSTFFEFLDCIDESVTEYTRFNWAEEYINQNGLFVEDSKNKSDQTENKKEGALYQPEQQNGKTLPNWMMLLEDIRFEDMSVDELCKGPLKSKLLKLEKKNEILVKKCKLLENLSEKDIKYQY